MAAKHVSLFLFTMFINQSKAIPLHVNISEVTEKEFDIKSHLKNEYVRKLCSIRNDVCRSNHTNICAMKMVDKKEYFKDFVNTCFLFMSNMCDQPTDEYYIVTDGYCEEYLAKRRNEDENENLEEELNLSIDNSHETLVNEDETLVNENETLVAKNKTLVKIKATTSFHKNKTLIKTKATTSVHKNKTLVKTKATTSVHKNKTLIKTKATTSVHKNKTLVKTKATTSVHKNKTSVKTKATTSVHKNKTPVKTKATTLAKTEVTLVDKNESSTDETVTETNEPDETTKRRHNDYKIVHAYDKHLCPYSCPNIYDPVCMNVNKRGGLAFKMYFFVNHCQSDAYYCKYPEEFQPPTKEFGFSVDRTVLARTRCASYRFIQMTRASEAISAMGHYGWLEGDERYSKILEPHERKPGYG